MKSSDVIILLGLGAVALFLASSREKLATANALDAETPISIIAVRAHPENPNDPTFDVSVFVRNGRGETFVVMIGTVQLITSTATVVYVGAEPSSLPWSTLAVAIKPYTPQLATASERAELVALLDDYRATDTKIQPFK